MSDPQTYWMHVSANVEADNDEDAEAIARRLAERVFEHPCVTEVEGLIEWPTGHGRKQG